MLESFRIPSIGGDEGFDGDDDCDDEEGFGGDEDLGGPETVELEQSIGHGEDLRLRVAPITPPTIEPINIRRSIVRNDQKNVGRSPQILLRFRESSAISAGGCLKMESGRTASIPSLIVSL